MKVRALSPLDDWKFGRGLSDYKTGVDAVAQNIKTRLKSFLGDCYFDLGAGIDWFNLLASPTGRLKLELAIRTTILNTENVVSLTTVDTTLSTNRAFHVVYSVNTAFGRVNDLLRYDLII